MIANSFFLYFQKRLQFRFYMKTTAALRSFINNCICCKEAYSISCYIQKRLHLQLYISLCLLSTAFLVVETTAASYDTNCYSSCYINPYISCLTYNNCSSSPRIRGRKDMPRRPQPWNRPSSSVVAHRVVFKYEIFHSTQLYWISSSDVWPQNYDNKLYCFLLQLIILTRWDCKNCSYEEQIQTISIFATHSI